MIDYNAQKVIDTTEAITLKEVRHLLTYDCELRCQHCYMSAGEHEEVTPVNFTQDQSDTFYDFFKPDIVSATGGEPLLEIDLVKKLARSTSRYGGSLELVTNGLLLSEDIVKELNNLNDRTFYQISLDGNKEFHDSLRNLSGAYEEAIKAIDLASASGRPTKVRLTVTSENYEQIPEVIERLDEYQRENIHLVMRPIIISGRAKDNHLNFGNINFSDLDKLAENTRFIHVETTDNQGKCGCGIDTIAINPIGEIYPCCYMVFTPEYKMGNMFDNYEGLKEHPSFVNFGGDCYARSLRK